MSCTIKVSLEKSLRANPIESGNQYILYSIRYPSKIIFKINKTDHEVFNFQHEMNFLSASRFVKINLK